VAIIGDGRKNVVDTGNEAEDLSLLEVPGRQQEYRLHGDEE
jgi:hypothetical protein